jgi:hypothetical protein
MSEETQDVSWIVPGALCNCKGEGMDTLLIRTIRDNGASVYVLKDGIGLDLSQAREQWQEGFYCWESFNKLHRDFLDGAEKHFNIIEIFGLEALEKVIKKIVKLIEVPCPENAQEMLEKYFDVKENGYSDAGYGTYVGAYLAEKILKADRNLAMAIGKILNHLYEMGLENTLSGYKNDTDGIVTKFIESLGIHNKVAKHYAVTANNWAEVMYDQSITKATGRTRSTN